MSGFCPESLKATFIPTRTDGDACFSVRLWPWLRSYQHGRPRTDGKKWRVQRNRSWCCGGGGDEGWTRCTLSADFLCTLLTDRAMCMVNTIIWYQYSLMIRLNLPSTWGWTLTHFTIYWMSALQSCGRNIPTTASLVKDTRLHLNCDQFLVVHAALLCLSRKSNALSKYRNAWKVQSLEWTDGKDRACTFLKKSSVSVRVSMNAFHVTSGNKERYPVHVFHLPQSSVSVRVGMNVP